MFPPFISRSYAYVQESVSSKLQNATIAVLASGPIPKHVAFVMDGNRRFARKAHKEIAQGHAEGFVALRRVLEICMNLGVECVSVYAFAIENFKRTPQEVDALMTLAEEKLKEMSQHGDLLDQYGIRLNVLGRKDLLPARVQEAVRKAEEMTAKNNNAVLNLCMPYASRDDITTAIESSVEKAVEDRDFEISEEDVDAFISTSAVGSPPIDIWVRTSGVRRLSDYMTWQACEGAQIQFSDKYWPSFSLWDFIPILLDYQRKLWSSAA